MGFFNSKKEMQERLDKLNQTVHLMQEQWESETTIRNKAIILEADTLLNMFTNAESKVDNTRLNATTYNQIQNMTLPSALSWDYWVMINQWADYWVNRYSDFDNVHKEQILTAIRIAVMYGVAAIDKETFTPYFVQLDTIYNDKLNLINATYMFNSTAVMIKNKNLYVSDKLKVVKNADRSKFVIFTWRAGNIGDFVWCMKQLLIDIYIKKIIECNTSHLTNKLFYKVKNPKNLAKEALVNSDPSTNIGIIIADEGADINTEANQLIERNKNVPEGHMVDLITAHKHHQEYYYNLFGRVITSSKNQTLSSDANLNVSSAELVAEEHDRRIVAALKELGINIEVNEVNPNKKPQNENADKEGQGFANTDADNVTEKVGN